MSPEERQMLADLFERIRANAATPRDPQADAFINDAVRQQPFAPYILAQTVLVQQQALEGAAHRISELEAQTRASAPAQETSFLGSLGRSLFGGGAAPPPPPPPQRPSGYDASAYQRGAPQAPPSYAPPPPGYGPPPQPGPWGAAAAPAGGGFLSGALRTAAGVAGGVVLGNALENMIGGRGGGLFGGGSALAAPGCSAAAALLRRLPRRSIITTRARPTAATRPSSSLIRARRASRTPTSIGRTTRTSTARTARPLTTAAAATTTSDASSAVGERWLRRGQENRA